VGSYPSVSRRTDAGSSPAPATKSRPYQATFFILAVLYFKVYVVYVLYSEAHNQIYVGYTSDLISRFHSHNTLAKKGHTIKFRPWIVAYAENYETKAEAMKREKVLKSPRGRAFIRNHINLLYN